MENNTPKTEHKISRDDVINFLQLVNMVSKTITDWMKMTEKHDKEVRYF